MQIDSSFRFSFLKTCTEEFPYRKVYQPDPRTCIDLVVIEKPWPFYKDVQALGGFIHEKIEVKGHRRVVALITEELLDSLSDEEFAIRYYSTVFTHH